MATRMFSRLFPKTLTLTTIHSRSLSTTTSAISFLSRLRPLSGAVITSRRVLLPPSFRSLSTRATSPFLDDPNPNHSDLKLRNGCDYYHRLVIMEAPDIDPSRDEPTRDEIKDSYVKTLAKVVGSEDEARMMVYLDIITTDQHAFGTLLSEELSDRVEALPRVVMILPDPIVNPIVNIENTAYGDETFLNGPPIPLDQFGEWLDMWEEELD